MTSEELKTARRAFGLSQSEFAQLFKVKADRTVRRWEEGEQEIPGPIIVLLELLLDCREARQALGLTIREPRG